jgi:ubiquinone/menaquinone biosynthesis C-methylase UbiE
VLISAHDACTGSAASGSSGLRVRLAALHDGADQLDTRHDSECRMNQSDAVFAGSIPQLYDAYIGPAMMVPYALELAARLAPLQTGRLLETAAGTGIVTSALVSALPGVEITVTDLNQPMLDHAASKPELGPIKFLQADALELPFDDGSFDAVVCQFGVMFFPDRPTAFREARRVLKDGGRFVFNVWDSVASNPIVSATLTGLSRRYPQQGSWFLERTPCGYRDPDVIRADLAAAGFTDCRIETVTLRGHAASPMALAIGFCQGTPMRAEIEALDPTGLQEATEAAAHAIAERFGSGAFETELGALVIETAR